MTPTTTPKPVPQRTFYVALVEGGVPKFSENPVPHSSLSAAKAEAERLARVHRGKLFQVFRTTTSPVHAFVPAEPSFSYYELQHTLPEGVYFVDYDAEGQTPFVVVGSGPTRTVLVFMGRNAQVLNARATFHSNRFRRAPMTVAEAFARMPR